MRFAFAIMTAIALFTLAFPTSVAACYTTSTPAAAVGNHYVVIDSCPPNCGSVYLYKETNNLPGLQRGDLVKSDVAACAGAFNSDEIVF